MQIVPQFGGFFNLFLLANYSIPPSRMIIRGKEEGMHLSLSKERHCSVMHVSICIKQNALEVSYKDLYLEAILLSLRILCIPFYLSSIRSMAGSFHSPDRKLGFGMYRRMLTSKVPS